MALTAMDSFVLRNCPSLQWCSFHLLGSLSRKTVVVGAGYIAVELASILAELGSETYLLIRYDRVLRTFDEMMSEVLTAQLLKGPVKLRQNTKVQRNWCLIHHKEFWIRWSKLRRTAKTESWMCTSRVDQCWIPLTSLFGLSDETHWALNWTWQPLKLIPRKPVTSSSTSTRTQQSPAFTRWEMCALRSLNSHPVAPPRPSLINSLINYPTQSQLLPAVDWPIAFLTARLTITSNTSPYRRWCSATLLWAQLDWPKVSRTQW